MNPSVRKILYSIKRFSIVTVAALLLASVEVAPDHPFRFIFLASAYLISIRFLWRSALADEKALASKIPRIKKKAVFDRQKQSKRAA